MTLDELKTQLGAKTGVLEVVSDPPRNVKFTFPVINVQYLFQASPEKVTTESFTVFQNPATQEVFYYKNIPGIMLDAPETREPFKSAQAIKDDIEGSTTFTVIDVAIQPRDGFDSARVTYEDATKVYPGKEYRIWRDEVQEFVQPQGAHDAYPMDKVVSYNGSYWKSLHSANVWAPTEGTEWTEVTEDDLTHMKPIDRSTQV